MTVNINDDHTTLHDALDGVRLQVEGVRAAYESNDLHQLNAEIIGLQHWAGELRRLNRSVFAAQATILAHHFQDGKVTPDEYYNELALLIAQANRTLA